MATASYSKLWYFLLQIPVTKKLMCLVTEEYVLFQDKDLNQTQVWKLRLCPGLEQVLKS